MLYNLKEWQSPTGQWHCAHTDSFPAGVSLWLVPARAMGMTADSYVRWVIEKYTPDRVNYSKDFSFVWWSWSSQLKMRKYKNDINAIMRKANYQV